MRNIVQQVPHRQAVRGGGLPAVGAVRASQGRRAVEAVRGVGRSRGGWGSFDWGMVKSWSVNEFHRPEQKEWSGKLNTNAHFFTLRPSKEKLFIYRGPASP